MSVLKSKKPEPKMTKPAAPVVIPKGLVSDDEPATAVASKQSSPARPARALVSIHPSEMKAVVLVGDKKHKVVYHSKDDQPMIGLPGEGSVKLADWLQGKAELKGLLQAR